MSSLRPNQTMALEVIANEKENNEPLILDEVLARLPYITTKQSFQFTLRSLIVKGYVEKGGRVNIDKKSRRLLRITPLGLNKLKQEREAGYRPIEREALGDTETKITDKLIKKIQEEYSL